MEFPDLEDPVSMTFDARGRLWVGTMPSYPMYLPGTKPNDKVLILEDVNEDGKADRCTTFADGLHLPIGIELGDGGVYLSQMPNLMFLKDTNGDDRADTRELIMHGFDTADSHHAMHAFTWDPGGALTGKRGPSTTRRSRRLMVRGGATRRGCFAGSPRPGSSTSSCRTASPIHGATTSTAGARTSWPTPRAEPTIRHGLLRPGGVSAEARRHEAVFPHAMAADLRLRAGQQPPFPRRHPGRLPPEQQHRLPGNSALPGQGRRLGLRR